MSPTDLVGNSSRMYKKKATASKNAVSGLPFSSARPLTEQSRSRQDGDAVPGRSRLDSISGAVQENQLSTGWSNPWLRNRNLSRARCRHRVLCLVLGAPIKMGRTGELTGKHSGSKDRIGKPGPEGSSVSLQRER